MVNNFINLNKKTVTTQYRMQDPNELLSRIAGAGFISKIDFRQSFWQVKLQEESYYTGFQCEFDCCSYKKMCMGLKNASFTMQRLIDRLLRGAHRFAGALLDDIIIYDNDFQLHLDHVRYIFDRLRSGGLTVNGGKCTLGASCLRVLGHLVQDGSILPDEQKTSAIANWSIPRTQKQSKRYLGLTSYFRGFIRDYAGIAHP